MIPPLDPHEALGIITGSEQNFKDYTSASSLNAKDIKRLIEELLHSPNFSADDVDKNMLEQFAIFIDFPCIIRKIISMHKEGDGAQKLVLFKRRF